MDMDEAIAALGALAQGTRLDVYRLLVRHEPAGLPAGEIARLVGVPHNTLSSHLAVLNRAGLVTSERHSRSIVYRASLARVGALADFLNEDCCAAGGAAMADAGCAPKENSAR